MRLNSKSQYLNFKQIPNPKSQIPMRVWNLNLENRICLGFSRFIGIPTLSGRVWCLEFITKANRNRENGGVHEK